MCDYAGSVAMGSELYWQAQLGERWGVLPLAFLLLRLLVWAVLAGWREGCSRMSGAFKVLLR